MAVAQGSNFKLYMKKQADDETLATGNFDQVPIAGQFSLTASQALQRDDLLSAGLGRDGGDPYLDYVSVEGTAGVPIDLIHFGRWLSMLLGPAVSSGTTDKTHVFKSGATTLPAFSMEKAFPEVPAFDMYMGVKANTLSFDLSPSGAANATIGLMGLSETTATTSGAGTPVFTQSQRFYRPSGTITKDGATLAKVTGGSAQFSNGMAGVRTVRPDNRIDSIDLGQSTAGGDLRVRFQDNVLKTQAISGTPCALAYGFTISATKSILFEFPRVYLSRPGISVTGPTGIELPVGWQAAFDQTAGCLMRVTLKNQITAYA